MRVRNLIMFHCLFGNNVSNVTAFNADNQKEKRVEHESASDFHRTSYSSQCAPQSGGKRENELISEGARAEAEKEVCAAFGVSLFIWDPSTSASPGPDQVIQCGTAAGRQSAPASTSLLLQAKNI